MLKALLAMGRVAAGGIFSWDPPSLALKTLLRARELPEGLSVMRTDSETLKAWQFGDEPFELHSYAGAYDLKALADGACAYTLGAIAEEAFAKSPNDLVVPTASAQGAGQAEQVPGSCDHFHYFETDALREELRQLA